MSYIIEIGFYFSFKFIFKRIKMCVFDIVVRFARLINIETKQVAHTLHLRFTSFTGDAMGMNMVSKVF